ncbi:MAG: S8 family serine peptidase [Patescibacteria group bacterium]|nr:S8 family serine peptidase [Patescibacteria group bacterium]
MEFKSFTAAEKIVVGILGVLAIFFIVSAVVSHWNPSMQRLSGAPPAILLNKPTATGELGTVSVPQPAPAQTYPMQVAIPLKSWSNIDTAKQMITAAGAQIVKVLDWPTGRVIIATVPNAAVAGQISKNSFWGNIAGAVGLSGWGNTISGGIDSVQADAKVYTQDQSVTWAATQIKADQVWHAADGTTGKGVKVAIIDTGVQHDHPDIAANVKGGINIMTGGTTPQDWADDCKESWGGIGHGTHAAGDIAAVDNTIGIVGVAPEASIYAVKVAGSDCAGTLSDMISGIYWAANNGMQVANISMGGQGIPSYWQDQERAAVDYAYQHGVVVVVAAGNYGATSDTGIDYPAIFSESVIAVGSSNPDNTLSSFSSYGPQMELVAPGVAITTTIPGSTYGVYSGTSESAPFVSGVAALILAKNPNFTPAQVRQRLDQTAIDLGTAGKDDTFGYGLVDAQEAVNPSLPVTFTMIAPTGGELWPEGTQQTVKWSAQNLSSTDDAMIQLMHVHSGTTDPIMLATSTPNSGSATVNIPADLSLGSGDSYYIQVGCVQSRAGACAPGKSGTLTIAAVPPQQLTLIYPKGGEQWPAGTQQPVAWSSNYPGGPGVNVTLMQNKKVPVYSYTGDTMSLVSETYSCVSSTNCTSGSSALGTFYAPGASGVPTDTCGGGGGRYFCPQTYTSSHFSCVSVDTGENTPGSFVRNVDCSYQQGAQTNTCYTADPDITQTAIVACNGWYGGWTVYDPKRAWPPGDPGTGDGEVLAKAPPQDTCDGSGGKYICPQTYSDEQFSCTDVWGTTSSTFPRARTVTCSFAKVQTGTKDEIQPVTALSSNIPNTGSTVVAVPGTASGADYYLQLSCANFSGTCTSPMSAPFSINQLTQPVSLTIAKTGGSGVVTDGNLVCSGNQATCTEQYQQGSTVTFAPPQPADPTTFFVGWSGACTGTSLCQLTTGGNQSLTANFGTRVITLTATPYLGSSFAGWSGACLTNGTCFTSWSSTCQNSIPCNITMSADQKVQATFVQGTLPQNATQPGSGIGSGGSAPTTTTAPPSSSSFQTQLKEVAPQ